LQNKEAELLKESQKKAIKAGDKEEKKP